MKILLKIVFSRFVNGLKTLFMNCKGILLSTELKTFAEQGSKAHFLMVLEPFLVH